MRSIVVVGASLAGLRAAQTLRGEGFDGSITMVGDERHLPYDRPPLSKQFLAGDWDVDKTMLTPAGGDLDDLDLTWHLGAPADGLDLGARAVIVGDARIDFDGLVIATGARCRTIPGTENLAGVHTLRTLDDSIAIRKDFASKPGRVVVVGAGFIGAEVAATARGLGLDVTMVEMASVPFERILGAAMGQVLTDVAVEHGVDVRTGVGVASIEGSDRVEGVRLSDGTTVDADVVVVGVGVTPNTEWLDRSGVMIDDGVLCDETLLVAPGVVAAGDVARWPNQRFDEIMRVEHWDNAADSAIYAARRLLDRHDGPYAPVPWFWSDQYDRKIQLAGRPRPDDRIEVVVGSVEERRFATAYGRNGKLVAVLGFNRPRHVMQYRQMIVEGVSWQHALQAQRQG